LFILYVVAYLDRVNVGFAALQMNADLKFGASVFGLGGGIFFLGYFLFEIPSNLILDRVGARLWITRIMISWGAAACATAFIQGSRTFYLVRFLLGIFEAGFFPGMILYLTYWLPARYRAKTIALFMTATAVSGVIGGPLSGMLLTMHGTAGLSGWQWLFIIEGAPAIVLGVIVLFYMTESPERAKWLSAEERNWLLRQLRGESRLREQHGIRDLSHAVRSGKVWLLSLIYFSLVMGMYGVGLWLPQIIKEMSDVSEIGIGMVSALPYLFAAIGMTFVGLNSDRTGERRLHTAGPALLSSAGLMLAACSEAPAMRIAGLSLAAIGIWGSLGPFWSLSTSFLCGSAAAGGIALINSIGNLGGFLGPYLVGVIKDITGVFKYGLIALSLIALVGASLALVVSTDASGKR
jgi:MFS transporter, ACS family, tartrate transporter